MHRSSHCGLDQFSSAQSVLQGYRRSASERVTCCSDCGTSLYPRNANFDHPFAPDTALSSQPPIPSSAGRQHDSRTSHWLEVRNPATQRLVATVPVTTAAELNTAVQTARAAFPKWAKRPMGSRVHTMFLFQEAIRDNIDELARLITQEQGKTLRDSYDDILRCAGAAWLLLSTHTSTHAHT